MYGGGFGSDVVVQTGSERGSNNPTEADPQPDRQNQTLDVSRGREEDDGASREEKRWRLD